MKKPKQFMSDSELSQVIVDICAIIFSVILAYVVLSANTLMVNIKVMTAIFLLVVVIICSIDLKFMHSTIKKRKEKLELVDSFCKQLHEESKEESK